MEDKAIFLLLSFLIALLLGVVAYQFFVIRRIKKTIQLLQGNPDQSNESISSNTESGSQPKNKLNKRPQLERVTIGEVSTIKPPIYVNSEDKESVEAFYYDDVRTTYNEPKEVNAIVEESQLVPEISEKGHKLTRSRLILLFAYMIAGLSLFVSIFYLMAAYLAAKG